MIFGFRKRLPVFAIGIIAKREGPKLSFSLIHWLALFAIVGTPVALVVTLARSLRRGLAQAKPEKSE